jgi:multisubunit Na+/H+ antiporter MnhC subunit
MKFVIALAVIGNGVYLLAQGKSLEGFAVIVFAVAALIAVLTYEHAEQEKEHERKRRRLRQAKAPRPPRHSS